jgi:hypothetical protein
MSPEVIWTALVCATAVSLALSASALGLACRRWRASAKVAERRLDALTERLARLEALRGLGVPSPMGGTGGLPTSVPGATPTGGQATSATPSVRGGRRRADRPEVSPLAGPILIAVPDLANRPSAAGLEAEASADLGRRFGAIWDLADAGAPADAIARATGLPIGRVELILGLRRRLASIEPRAGAGPRAVTPPGPRQP